MKHLFFVLCILGLVGCQQPVVINGREDCHHHDEVIIQQPVVVQQQPIIVQPTPPVVVPGCCLNNHCGRYSCPVCRANCWFVCNPHDHCGGCPNCRNHGWIGVRIGGPRIGIGIGVHR